MFGSKNTLQLNRKAIRHPYTRWFSSPSTLPLLLNARTLCRVHIHFTHGSIHCGDTRERNLHFQLNCRPSLQNAKLDFVPSSPGLLLLPSQPNNRENMVLRHTDEDHWSQQNDECIYHTVNIWEGKLRKLERRLTNIDFYILSTSVLIYLFVWHKQPSQINSALWSPQITLQQML